VFAETLVKGPKNPRQRQRALGKFWVGKEGLCRGLFIGHSAKKSNYDGVVSLDGVFAEGIYPRPSAKKIYFFSKKSLCRGPPPTTLGKEILQVFSKKALPRDIVKVIGKDQFFAKGPSQCPRQRKENLFFCFCFFEFRRGKHFIYIHIHISTITYILLLSPTIILILTHP